MTTAEEIRARIAVIETTLSVLYERRARDRIAAKPNQAADAARPPIAADIDIEIDAPRMQDVLRGYTRLPIR